MLKNTTIQFTKNNHTQNSGDIACLLIAAGNSSRLGQPKQLIKYNNETLLKKTAKLAINFSPYAFCVLGFNHLSMQKELHQLCIKTLINDNWQAGMGSSIATGIQAIPDSCQGVLILLCDQWMITQNDLINIYQIWKKNQQKIVANNYFDDKYKKQVSGTPAIFPRSYFDKLSLLKTQGARKIIEQSSQVITINNKSAAFDLDIPSDLDKLCQCAN